MVGKGDDPNKFAAKIPVIKITTQLLSNDIVIRIKDNGPGISKENLARVREPLFTTKSFGTGLGVPAIEQIASQHGGSLKIHSVVGEGASFTLLLPVQMEKEEAA